ncbi:MAG: tyrosine-type recombinase/integrase [Candidatus Hodarchaeota archaeon]
MVKQKKVLTVNQCNKFIKNANTIQEKLMIRMMLKCGLRVSELINCQISWINFEDQLLYIQENKKPYEWVPKRDSIREVPISEELLIELKQFIVNRKKGYLFRSRKKTNYRRYNKDSIIRKINKIAKEVLGKNTGTHIFRRTYASHLLNEGNDLETIRKLLGHADLKTTFLYLKNIPDRNNYDKIRNMRIMRL